MHSRISDTYLLLLHPPSIRGKKRGCISRIVRSHNGWLVDEAPIRRSPNTGIYFKIRVLDREEEGRGWEKQREGKFPGAN